jgi:zinc protease
MLLVTLLVVGLFAAPGPGVQMVTLKNGVRVVLAPDARATALDVALWYEAGPLFERTGKSGITHLVERLLLRSRGADTASFHNALALEGVQASSITTPDYSSLFATGPAESADLVIRQLGAVARSAAADSAMVAAEREGVLDERATRLEGSLAARALERLFSMVFAGHGYGRPVIGLASDVSGITAADVASYRAERFGPANMTVSVIGRFDSKAALATIKREFEGIKPAKSAPKSGKGGNARLAAPPVPSEPQRALEPAPAGGQAVAAGWRAPAANDADRAALEVLARIAGSGPESRIGKRQSEPEWPIGLSRVVFDPRRTGSVLYAVAVPNPGSELSAVERTLVGTIETMATEPITPEEVRRARTLIEREAMLERQTVRGRARMLGAALFEEDDAGGREKWRESLAAVTNADVQRAAARVLKPALRSVVTVMPAAPDSGGAR